MCQQLEARSVTDVSHAGYDGPWLYTLADFCGPLPIGEMALVVLDAYSKCPEVKLLSSTSAAATQTNLRNTRNTRSHENRVNRLKTKLSKNL